MKIGTNRRKVVGIIELLVVEGRKKKDNENTLETNTYYIKTYITCIHQLLINC